MYDKGYEKHQVIPECDIPKDSLSDEEFATYSSERNTFLRNAINDYAKVVRQSYKQKEIVSQPPKVRCYFYIQSYNWGQSDDASDNLSK